MRKIIAILLLSVFALYHFGYYGFYYTFSFQLESYWTDKVFETDEAEEEMMEIPISVPYMADQSEFQVTNTTFEKDGKNYRAVKQRYSNDTLQVVYVPDTAKNKLDSVVKKWIASLVSDEVPCENSNSLLSKIFIKDYTKPNQEFILTAWLGQEKKYIGFIFSTYNEAYHNNSTPPPEFA
ncbi:hypothetical protein ACFSKL_08870 [Belliella marina]|uniref:Uncharacterized protein n=1 Tax=Belliella marina TaxID=1644146 RepID=A0ABW4VM85_9BACT